MTMMAMMTMTSSSTFTGGRWLSEALGSINLCQPHCCLIPAQSLSNDIQASTGEYSV
jgi:hypothetical protein